MRESDEEFMVNMVGSSTTRIGVKRIVIEVNRDLTVEQLEVLDNALKQVGLVKTTKVTFHKATTHRPKSVRPAHPTFRIGHDSSQPHSQQTEESTLRRIPSR